MKKLNVGIVTSSLLVKTGFSTFARVLIPFLYKKNKYNIFHLNQGIGDDPNLEGRFPWKNWGVFRLGTFDQNRFNSNDEGYKRNTSYGNEIIEKFVIENKIEILILIEDLWAFSVESYLNSKWYQKLKDNVLIHVTPDSIPILPLYKEWAEKCNNVWYWGSFAVKELQKENFEKYKHIKHVFGTLDINEYFPILEYQKRELRKEFNIDQNCNLFIFLGRNQLRKIFPSALECFYKFKKQNPEKKAKLLFFCSWSEPMGWPLERLTKDFGLEKEDVLCVYFCRNCNKWEIKPFLGEEQNCRYCNAQKSQITPGVTSTITNKELSKIYGICDASLSISTSSGLEMTNCQSLLCGLPLLATDYAGSQDFASQDFVFSLDGTFSYEVGTGFKKHTPNQNTIIKFFKTICEMSLEKRKEIGHKGREWALKTFDIKIIGPIFEEWIDSRKLINWDYIYKEELKDPIAQIPNIEDNKEYVKTLYKNILKCDVRDDNEGLISWITRLQQGQPRQEIEQYFRSVGLEDNKKILESRRRLEQSKDKKPVTYNFENFLDNNGRKRFLLVVKQDLGDCINSLALLKSLKEQYFDYDIYVACDNNFKEVFDGNEYIYKILTYEDCMQYEIIMTGQGNNKGFFDGYSLLTVATQHKLNYLCNNKIALELEYK